MIRSILLGASALAISSAAFAQSTKPPVKPASADQEVAGAGLVDIIVTATKVETTLQKTPQAITALDSEALTRAGVSSAQDLSKLVTGLNVESNGSNASIFIRGVGSRTFTPTADPAIAFSVDGVFYSRSSGITTTFFDVGRVEVVKGPQGTLYGRNATGGAVNLITNRPQIGVRSLDGEIEVGNYSAIRTNVAVNLPLGSRAAFRLAAVSDYNTGYLSDGHNDRNVKAGRASLYWEPDDAIAVFASVDYAKQGGMGPGYVPVGPSNGNNSLVTRFGVPGDPFVGPSDPRINAVLQAAAPPQAVSGPTPGIFCRAQVVGAPTPGGIPARLLCMFPLGVDQITKDAFLDNQFYGGNITIDTDLGFAKLTTIAGYRHTDINVLQRNEIGRTFLTTDADQYTAEVRLSSNVSSTSRLKWVVGGFYLRENQANTAAVSASNVAIPLPTITCATAPVGGFCLARPALIQAQAVVIDPDTVNESYAGFGQATFDIADELRVTGGIRVTHETKSAENGSITAVYTLPAGLRRTFPSQGFVSFDNKSYRLGIELDITPRSMLYAHYSTGFHAGGFNLGVEAGPNRYPYDPEEIKSYVVGIKNRFFNNKLQFNIEAFWLDYKNYQFNSQGYINDGSAACTGAGIRTACPLSVRTDNAKGARLRGVEADLAWRILDHGTLDLSVLYNDGTYRSFDVTSPFTGAVTSYAGVQLPAVNKWTVGAGYTHKVPLNNDGQVVFSARTQYRDGKFIWYTQLPAHYQEGYTRTDLSLAYEAPKGQWSLRAFVRNLENKATSFQGAAPNVASGIFFTVLNPPRTYGLNLGFHF